MISHEFYENLELRLFESGKEAGYDAGKALIGKINELLEKKSLVSIIFAAAPSQNFLHEFIREHQDEADWSRVDAFHMDEYLNLPSGSEQLFSSFLNRNLFDHVPFRQINLIDSENKEGLNSYEELLKGRHIDIVCLGIGENGHLAFNDPPVADFDDKEIVKVVALDNVCRMQQVNDGCFDSLDLVPKEAITLTIPTLIGADNLFCLVPGYTKRSAVNKTLHDPVSEKCPATILRKHPNCILFVDEESYPFKVIEK